MISAKALNSIITLLLCLEIGVLALDVHNLRAKNTAILTQVRMHEADQLRADAAWFEAGCEWALVSSNGPEVREAAHQLCEQAELKIALTLSERQSR
jgi:riboflavin biosynthesis pyrimidine reductase